MEQILYDTSSLINAYKQRKQLTGYTTILNVVEFQKLLELALTVIYPSKSDYNLAIKLSKDLLKIGKPIPAIDIIIAVVALNRNMKLVATDNHFAAIQKIRSGFEFVIENS
ncbi:MAG: type II toxin-antitoxin system VapC family toxin [Halobacteriota archaeon]